MFIDRPGFRAALRLGPTFFTYPALADKPSTYMKFRNNNHQGFTLLELLVVIAIIAVLAALLFPYLSRMSSRGLTAKCTNFQQQIGGAVLRYAAENEMTLPVTSHQRRAGGKSWSITLQPYADGTLCFRCPCDENTERSYSYAMNDFLTPNPAGAPDLDFSRLARLEKQRETILFAEMAKEYKNSDHFHFSPYRGGLIPPESMEGQIAVKRHDGAANYLFADGHVETLAWVQVSKNLREQGNRFVDPTAVAPNP